MPKRFQETWADVTHAVTAMRGGASLSEAAQQSGVSPRTIAHLGRSALHKDKRGRWVAKARDRLLRVVVVNAQEGLQEVATRDSREASAAGEHSALVHFFLSTGNDSGLRSFRRKYIKDANGKKVRLLTDLGELVRRGNAGVLSFESLYARLA